jgi:hypothetical protein
MILAGMARKNNGKHDAKALFSHQAEPEAQPERK